MAEIDPASTAGIALTVLGYAAGVSFAGLLAQIIFAPYLWYITAREFGARGFFYVRWQEMHALRQKYPFYRFLWNMSLTFGIVLIASLLLSAMIFARYSL